MNRPNERRTGATASEDKALAAYTIANTAAAMGMEVTIFFTFWGLQTVARNVDKCSQVWYTASNTSRGRLDAIFGMGQETGYQLSLGFEFIEAAPSAQGRRVVIADETEEMEDIWPDFDLVTSMCARIYGKRRPDIGARNRAKRALKVVRNGEGQD